MASPSYALAPAPYNPALSVRQPPWMNRIQGMYASEPVNIVQKVTVGEVLLATLGASATGGILGAMHSELKNGLDFGGKVPIDGVLAVLAMAGGAAYNSPGSVRVGSNAMAIYSFRKTADLLTLVRSFVSGEKKTVTPPDMSQNELEDAAKDL